MSADDDAHARTVDGLNRALAWERAQSAAAPVRMALDAHQIALLDELTTIWNADRCARGLVSLSSENILTRAIDLAIGLITRKVEI